MILRTGFTAESASYSDHHGFKGETVRVLIIIIIIIIIIMHEASPQPLMFFSLSAERSREGVSPKREGGTLSWFSLPRDDGKKPFQILISAAENS